MSLIEFEEKTVDSLLQLTGIGLRTPHVQDVLEKRPKLAWLEVHSENYFAEGGKPLENLLRIREHYPISLHGVSLSIGTADELNWQHLKKLKNLMMQIEPCLVSDHLCWSSIDGHYLHDLLPLPQTEESLTHVVTRIQQIQDFLQRQLLIENISSYVRFENTIPENEFLISVAERSGCAILLDMNNIYVNAMNFNEDANAYLAKIPGKFVHEIHLAGFTTTTINQKEILIDSHSRAVVPAVWDLYRAAIQQFGTRPTIIEWDNDIPSLETLCLEAYRAEKMMREYYVNSKLAG